MLQFCLSVKNWCLLSRLSFQIKSRKRLAKAVLVFVGLFAVCWLPSHVIYLYRSYHYDQVDTSLGHFIASVCARILAFANSCVNPFALYLMSKSFSKHFRQQLLCCTSPRRLDSQSSGSTNITTVWRRVCFQTFNYRFSCFNAQKKMFCRSPSDFSLFSLFMALSRTATRFCCTFCIDNNSFIHSFIHSYSNRVSVMLILCNTCNLQKLSVNVLFCIIFTMYSLDNILKFMYS